MTAEDLFKAGQLTEALAEQTARVKQSPTDSDARFMLFVLLCFTGQVERAGKQLEVLAGQDDAIRQGALVYHALLQAEWERQAVFAGKSRPVLPPEAPAHVETRAKALQSLARGDGETAAREVEAAFDATPAVGGRLDDAAFDDLRDDDELLGPVFEVFAGGRYLWMPSERLRSLEFAPPSTALDTLWRQVRLEDTDGVVADVHLPVLYAASGSHESDAVRLGRMTEWRDENGFFVGQGQHLLVADCAGERVERPILQLGRIVFGSGA